MTESSKAILSGLWLSTEAPAGAERLLNLPLIILVGVTGVGKSTALSALNAQQWRILPDRREVTDAVMIAPLAGRAVTDRQERFALTAQYRRAHLGGMAQALGELCTVPAAEGLSAEGLVFDGLRGLDEVRYAAQNAPSWRFIHLHAPDVVRVQRLLGRGDAFDQVAATADFNHNLTAELTALSGAAQVFTPAELSQLAALSAEGHQASDIVAKTKIVLSERQNYDPAAARDFLLSLPPERLLDLDTNMLLPAEVARRVGAWL